MAKNNTQNILKLKDRRITAWITSLPLGHTIAEKNDTKIKIILKISDVPMYIAFNNEVSDEMVSKLQQSLDQMRHDDEMDRILLKWRVVEPSK